MSAIALTLIVGGIVLIRGAIKGMGPSESFADVFNRAGGGPGLTPQSSAFIASRAASDAAKHPASRNDPVFPPNVERWRGLVATHFPAAVVNQALSVMEGESEGNPMAKNPVSGASGLFQHMPAFWASRSRQAGVPGGNIYDPVANVTVAGWLYRQSGTWDHWSSKPKVS